MIMKKFHLFTVLLCAVCVVVKGDWHMCTGEGSWINFMRGRAGNALDYFDYIKCSDGSDGLVDAGNGHGGDPWSISDTEGYKGIKSGWWIGHIEATSGFSAKIYVNNNYVGPFGSQYDGLTERLCSGNTKVNGIFASTVTVGSTNVVGVNLLPSCTITKYECPAGVVVGLSMNSGGGVDKITGITCLFDGTTEGTTTLSVGGDSGGAGTASGGPFTGFRRSVFNSPSTNMLSGLIFKKVDGTTTAQFGSDTGGGALSDQDCSEGQVITGFNMPQAFYSTWHLVGASLSPLCGCQSIKLMPHCTEQDASSCKCTACEAGYVLDTNAVAGATASCIRKYECPAGVVVGVSMNSGGGVDKITGITCLFDGGTTGSTTLYVGGDSGGPGVASGGPFTGFKRSIFNSPSTNMLSGLIFKKLDGSTTAQFGSDTGGGPLGDMDCPPGLVITGFYIPEAFYGSWHLVGSGLAPICGCQSIPNCTQQTILSNCACTACAEGYVVNNGGCTTPAPTPQPTVAPTKRTRAPTTINPTAAPTAAPTSVPTSQPTAAPTKTKKPTAVPTSVPTVAPTKTKKPTAAPTAASTPVRSLT